MNKSIIVIAFLFITGFTVSVSGQINLDFSSGINNSNSKFQNFGIIATQPRWGYFFGITPNYQLHEKIKLAIDFQHSVKGFNIDNPNNQTASAYKFSYLDIIPEVEYLVSRNLTFGLGINYGLKLSEQSKFKNSAWMNMNDFTTIKSTDFGLTGTLTIFHHNVFGFARYNLGLKNISDVILTDENGQVSDQAKQLNRNIQIGLGYTLNFKKTHIPADRQI
ncbi:MAG: outer membrane beta-barrel protein [Saprospiraceae bacterium]|nr:outer membrane beta-barrel protein [Saprospiraceae bacterium]